METHDINFAKRPLGISFLQLQRCRHQLDKLFDTIIEQNKSTIAKADERMSENLVDVLLKIQADGTERLLTNDSIKAVLMDMFGAGTDTSTIIVEWAMSDMIKKNPCKLKKAQKEVRKVFGDKGYVDEDKFTKLKYLKLVMKETLRMHPPAPILAPRVNYERCEINGYEIPAKPRVIVNAWALGRDSRLAPLISKGTISNSYPLAHEEEYVRISCIDWKMPLGMKNELDMSELFGVAVNRKTALHLILIVKRPLAATA